MNVQMYTSEESYISTARDILASHLTDDYIKDVSLIATKAEYYDILSFIDRERYDVVDMRCSGEYLIISSLKSDSMLGSQLYVQSVHNAEGDKILDDSDVLIISPNVPESIKSFYKEEGEYGGIFEFIPLHKIKDAYIKVVKSDDA